MSEVGMELGPMVTRDGVRFRVWAPVAEQVELSVEPDGAPVQMERGTDGYWTVLIPAARPGTLYRYRVDGAGPFPDPCSPSQPHGPHGSSEVVDPSAFTWTDSNWRGIDASELIIYELHVGTFTRQGTFDALIAELPRLRKLGVTAIELMPVAEFPGRWGWGYDGVSLWAPASVYGGPAGLRRLVNAAHGEGLAVLLDAVYNHLGPDGNYLRAFSPQYFTDRYHTPWGDALNFDSIGSVEVRHFILGSVEQWIRDYHLDGLRLDATHAMWDSSATHILEEIGGRARIAAGERHVIIIAENETNDVRVIRTRAQGGYGLDGVWADDFHHAVRVHLTGERDGYYSGYSGTAEEIARALAGGFVYQGQPVPTTGELRGTRVTDEPGHAFVFCIQNHDQVGNRALGEPLAALVDRGRFLAASALLLLAPETPLLFQGQEYGAHTPFLYFTDHHAELGKLVTEGRRQEFAGFAAFRDPQRRSHIPDPQAEETFLRSKLDPDERARNAATERLYHDLLALRRTDPVLSRPDRLATQAYVPTGSIVVMRRSGPSSAGERIILINFGDTTTITWAQIGGEPSTAPRLLWRSTAAEYDGSGEEPELRGMVLQLPARAALVLTTGE